MLSNHLSSIQRVHDKKVTSWVLQIDDSTPWPEIWYTSFLAARGESGFEFSLRIWK